MPFKCKLKISFNQNYWKIKEKSKLKRIFLLIKYDLFRLAVDVPFEIFLISRASCVSKENYKQLDT